MNYMKYKANVHTMRCKGEGFLQRLAKHLEPFCFQALMFIML